MTERQGPLQAGKIKKPSTETVEVDARPELPVSLPPEVKAEIESDRALAKRAELPENVRSFIEAVAIGHVNADELFERKLDMHRRARLFALQQTEPEWWTLYKINDSITIAKPRKAACLMFADVFSVRCFNFRPVNPDGVWAPARVKTDDGYRLEASCAAVSLVNGRIENDVMAARASTEKFIGRATKGPAYDPNVAESDLALSVTSLLRAKAAAVLSGIVEVPLVSLMRIWKEARMEDKCRPERFHHGFGFGSADERRTTATASDDAKVARKELGDMLLQITGGSKEEAKHLLVEITSQDEVLDKDGSVKKKAFAGFDSIAKLTRSWQVENAWKKLKQHPSYKAYSGE